MALFLALALSSTSVRAEIGKWIVLNDGHKFPTISLGTCCGSKPQVGLAPWIQAGGESPQSIFRKQGNSLA